MNMRRKLIGLVFCLLTCGAVDMMAQMQLTDTQVNQYVQQGLQQGKDERTIVLELQNMGATQEQLLKARDVYSQMQSSMGGGMYPNGMVGQGLMNGQKSPDSRSREVNKKKDDTPENNDLLKSKSLDNYQKKKEAKKNEKVERSDEYLMSKEMRESKRKRIELEKLLKGEDYEDEEDEEKEEDPEDQVFGRNIFNIENLTFEPNNNVATPANYCLGPGDEVIIDIWGASQTTIREEVSPDGYVNIPNLGPVYLNNMTVDEARKVLKEQLKTIYADSANNIQVTLGNIRTIQVNVMGEVRAPGSYVLSSFSTVFHALYASGGVSDIGSLRNVRVSRAGKSVASLDVYDYILNGRIEDDIRLQDGDVVIVPAYDELVKITGKVKRPMFYEMKDGETMAALLDYAGGFMADAYKKSVSVQRKNGREYSVATVDELDFSAFKTMDGDVVTVDSILDRFSNRLEVRGALYHPGVYELSGSLNTVRQLVEKADGLLGDAFLSRAVLYRERENLTKEVISVDIKGILDGTSPDMPLQKNDILYVPSIHDLKDLGTVKIFGEVNQPGEYTYAENMCLEDLVITAGGLKESASIARVDVSRRIRDPKSTEETPTVGQNFTFQLKNGFVIDGQPGFTLEPYDQVYVRRSPSFSEQKNVTVQGEVLFDGQYALNTKSERLSSIITRAGGVNSFAYVRGAKLIRVANSEELKRMEDVIRMIRKELGTEEISALDLKVDSTFTVGIDLEKALANPGSDADIVLRAGDTIRVPEYNNTVKINGAVMLPNTVSYIKGKGVDYYLSQAGGYSNNAKKRQKFIIYMNGQVAKVKGGGKDQIEPGCEIVVPSKKRNFNFATLMSGASSFASLATMITSIVALMKN